VRGETVPEIVGGARALRARMLRAEAPGNAVDTCGTGGDAAGTYNISTAAAFVLAGTGVPVAKHGNRSVSSKSGSSDVLAALGVNLDAPLAATEKAIREAGIGFLFAPRHHGAMRHVAPVRQSLRLRTLFNLLGPLANPAGVSRQVLGVYSDEWLMPLAEVLKQLGAESAWVVHGADGLDELSTTGENKVVVLKNGKISEMTVTPDEVGLPRAKLKDLVGGDADENAKALLRLLEGEEGPYRDIVLLNAAAGLVVAGRATGLEEGVHIAKSTIDAGSAKRALNELIRITGEVAG
jgi:anthranilate phosphoribosyltransferase